MSNNPIPVAKFLFKEDLKSLNEALRLPPGFEVEDVANANDLATYLSTVPAGLVIASLKNKDDLVQIASFMKLSKKLAKDCTSKVVVINFSGDRAYEKAIAKLGILDLVEPSINTKALKFKLDFWMKSLTAQAKLNNKGETTQKVKSGEQNKQGADKKQDPSTPVWAPALEIEDDIWLIKDTEVKKILGKWLIRVVGPSPYVGQWLELKPGLWGYDIKESEKEMFVPNEGAWYYSGDQKPDFVWKENNWLITGESFDLFFKDSNQITSRLKSKDKILTVCKNSLYAKTKEQIIIESFDKELVFKKEAEKLENLEGEGKTDKTNNGNLEGKNKTEKIDQGNLEGKTKTAADKSDNLKGKIENQDGITNENLEQKANNSREKTYWDGKNEYKQEEVSDLGLKGEKSRNDKNLDGKTEGEHEKFYKNHNEAKQYGEAELGKGEKKKGEFEDKQAKDLNGKSSTDEIPGHYDNSKKSKERAEKEQRPEEMSGKSETERLKSHYGQKDHERSEKEQRAEEMSGKSETDKLKSHYGQKETDRERSEKEQRPDEMSGKSGTDKLKSHYGQKEHDRENGERSEKEQRPDEMSGKSETDKLKSHYGKKEHNRDLSEEEDDQDEVSANERAGSTKLKSHSAQKERAASEKEESDEDYSGKSSTDKIAGHYGGPKNPQGKEDKENKDKQSREFTEIERLEKSKEKSLHSKNAGSFSDEYTEDDSEDLHDSSSADMYARNKKDRSEESESQKDDDILARKRNDKNKSGDRDTDFDADDFRSSKKSASGRNSEADLSAEDAAALEKLRSFAKKSSQAKSNGDEKESQDDLEEARASKKEHTKADGYGNRNHNSSSEKQSQESVGKVADILPLNKVRTEKAREATKVALDEKGLDELTRDSRVISYLLYKGKKIECELNDFFDDSIIFLTKERGIELSSKVQLDLAFKFLEKDKKLNMEGSVLTIDGDGEGNNFVTIQLTKENTAAFDVFMRLYETRQSNVNEFMKKVKGL